MWIHFSDGNLLVAIYWRAVHFMLQYIVCFEVLQVFIENNLFINFDTE